MIPSEFPCDLITEEHELDLLEKGVDHLRKKSQVKVEEIRKRQEAGKEVSPEDKDFIDNGANFIDEQLIIDHLITLDESLTFKLTQSQFNNLTKVIQSYNKELIENEEHKKKKQCDNKAMKDSKHPTSSKKPARKPIKIAKHKP
ncbi:hypothetical protein DFH28DRAFT_1123611 [Melampsora americana]|nr:hypothetical protein DFH28DRAFT_1123611 [Melampsora americana]